MVGRCAFAWVLGALAACSVKVDFGGTQYQCPDGNCPPGFVCIEGACQVDSAGDGGPLDAGADGGGGEVVSCGDPALVAESFGGSLPWWHYQSGTASIEDGALLIEAAGALGEFTAFGDQLHTRLEGNRLSLEVSNIISSEPRFHYYERENVEIFIDGSELVAEIDYGGASTSDSVPYDSVAHRFWSLAESNGTVSVDVSPDGVAWTSLHSRQTEVSPEFGHLEIGVRSLGVGGSVKFDNLNGGGPPATIACTLDDGPETFDDSIIGPSYTDYTTDCARNITAGRMRWTLSNEGGAEPSCGIDATWRIDLRDATFGVEITAYPTYADEMYHYLELRGASGSAAFYVTPTGLFADYCDPNCSDLGFAVLDPGAHRFWRFRAIEGALFWEVSPDQSSWVALASVDDAFDLAAVQLSSRFGIDAPSTAVLELDNFGPMP